MITDKQIFSLVPEKSYVRYAGANYRVAGYDTQAGVEWYIKIYDDPLSDHISEVKAKDCEIVKFTLLKDTPTIATDNTLPPSSPTATAEEEINLQKAKDQIAHENGYINWAHFNTDVYGYQDKVLIFLDKAAHRYASLKEQEAHNRAVQECIDFIKDWYENERALEGKDFYEELEKLK